MSDPEVLIEKRGVAFWITINRPERRNALTSEVLEGLTRGYEAAQADTQVRVIVLTGAGDKAFCAGGDLQPGKNFEFDRSRPTTEYADFARLARRSHLPSIARVNGACVAGGMGLVAMTDIAVAAEHAVFGLPEVRVGLFPMQVLALLKAFVSPRLLREWSLTGERFDAQTARAAGLINHVVPAAELDTKVGALVESLAEGSPAAQRRGLYALRAIESMTTPEALAFTEGQIALMSATQDASEGRAAFNERRKPRWTGK